MQHPFAVLGPEYTAMLKAVTVMNPGQVQQQAASLVANMSRYSAVSAATGVPAAVLAALNMRESGGSFSGNLCNGDPLTGPTTHVPAGRPPGVRFPCSWETAALDAVRYDGLDKLTVPAWSMAYACWKAEAYNGFGPRSRGHVSGYLWAGTTGYDGGKFVKDGVWDPDAFDRQLGVVPLIWGMVQLRADLDFGGASRAWSAGTGEIPKDTAPPEGVGGGRDVKTIQRYLNALHVPGTPLLEDGSYGRFTRNVIKSYQAMRGLDIDGLAGPKTCAALWRDVADLDRSKGPPT